MELSQILTLSTAHLHPLEGAKIDKVAYIASDTCSLVNTDPGMYGFYIEESMPCLVELLKLVKEQYNDVAYVLFDADAVMVDFIKSYDW
jgi:hypothetical protein